MDEEEDPFAMMEDGSVADGGSDVDEEGDCEDDLVDGDFVDDGNGDGGGRREDRTVTNCWVCSASLVQLNSADAENHLNECLDRSSKPAPKPAISSIACPICNIIMDDYSMKMRDSHVNRCIESGGAVEVERAPSAVKEPPSNSSSSSNGKGKAAKVVESISKGPLQAVQLSSKSPPMKDSSSSKGDINSFLMAAARKQRALEKEREEEPPLKRMKSGRRGAAATDASGPVNRRTGKCPFIKRIPNSSFIVDGFQYACSDLSSVYFLSHFHSDHYIGLYKSFDCGKIYATPSTIDLIKLNIGVKEENLVPVHLNKPFLLHNTKVVLVDANHCPGSCMIIFQHSNGDVHFHTGDFRYHKGMLDDPCIKDAIEYGVRSLFLDTTYCNPKYTFPSQESSINVVCDLVEKHWNGGKTLFVFGAYSIGKERVYVAVAKKFKCKIAVDKHRYRLLECFGWGEDIMSLFTLNNEETNCRVVSLGKINMETLVPFMRKTSEKYSNIVAFKPTGWTYNSSANYSMTQRDKVFVYGVSYSEHSSYLELREFVSKVKSERIIPTVNCTSKKKVQAMINLLTQPKLK